MTKAITLVFKFPSREQARHFQTAVSQSAYTRLDVRGLPPGSEGATESEEDEEDRESGAVVAGKRSTEVWVQSPSCDPAHLLAAVKKNEGELSYYYGGTV